MSICQNRALSHHCLLSLEKAVEFISTRVPSFWRAPRCEAKAFQKIFLSFGDDCFAMIFCSRRPQAVTARLQAVQGERQSVAILPLSTTICSLQCVAAIKTHSTMSTPSSLNQHDSKMARMPQLTGIPSFDAPIDVSPAWDSVPDTVPQRVTPHECMSRDLDRLLQEMTGSCRT